MQDHGSHVPSFAYNRSQLPEPHRPLFRLLTNRLVWASSRPVNSAITCTLISLTLQVIISLACDGLGTILPHKLLKDKTKPKKKLSTLRANNDGAREVFGRWDKDLGQEVDVSKNSGLDKEDGKEDLEPD